MMGVVTMAVMVVRDLDDLGIRRRYHDFRKPPYSS